MNTYYTILPNANYLIAYTICDPPSRDSIVYTYDRKTSVLLNQRPDIPTELRRKRRERRSGVMCRAKMDELTALTRLRREYRECSVMWSTETCVSQLQTAHPQSLTLISGDFNNSSLSSSTHPPSPPRCRTRDNKTLDLMYANIDDAYNSSSPPAMALRSHRECTPHFGNLMTIYMFTDQKVFGLSVHHRRSSPVKMAGFFHSSRVNIS